MSRRSPPRKVTYFEPVLPRLARNIIFESTFEVGRRFRCTIVEGIGHMRVPLAADRLDDRAGIERATIEELADWRAGRNAVYQLAATRSARALRSPTVKCL